MSIRSSFGAIALAGALAGLTGCSDITGSDDATIIVENNSSVAVHFLFIAECDDSTWGDDELGTATIAPAAARDFDVAAGCYDLRAEFSDLTFAEDFGIDVGEGDEFTWELID